MTGGWGRKNAATIACVVALGVTSHEAAAQAASGVNITADINARLEVDDNRSLSQSSPGTSSRFVTDLTFGLSTETPTTRLGLQVGGQLRAEDNANGNNDNGFDNPFVRLSFGLEGPDSDLDAQVRFKTRRIEDSFLTDLDGDFLEDDLISDVGDVEDTNASVTYRFGLNAPVGGSVTVSRRERNYSGTTNPDLFDRTTDRIRATGTFRLSPVATGRAILSASDYTAEDVLDTDRTVTAFGVGLSYELSPALRFDGEILDNSIEIAETIGASRITRETTGYSGFARLTRDLPNGNISVTAQSELSSATSRNTLFARRAMQLPGADLAFGVGVTESDTGDTTFLGSLDYARELPIGVLTASVAQSAALNGDEEEVLRTTVNVGFIRELTRYSSLDVALGLAKTEDIGLGSVTEKTETELTVDYRRELNEDWDWSIGYRGRQSRTPSSSTATSNAIVTSFQRSFSLRP